MPAVVMDSNYHLMEPSPDQANLAPGAVGTSAVGTIAPLAVSGSSSAVTLATGQFANDRRGVFTLTSGGTGQATGANILVTFAVPYANIPMVIVNLINTTSGLPLACGVTAVTASSFEISVAADVVATDVYIVSYIVIP